MKPWTRERWKFYLAWSWLIFGASLQREYCIWAYPWLLHIDNSKVPYFLSQSRVLEAPVSSSLHQLWRRDCLNIRYGRMLRQFTGDDKTGGKGLRRLRVTRSLVENSPSSPSVASSPTKCLAANEGRDASPSSASGLGIDYPSCRKHRIICTVHKSFPHNSERVYDLIVFELPARAVYEYSNLNENKLGLPRHPTT